MGQWTMLYVGYAQALLNGLAYLATVEVLGDVMIKCSMFCI